jgi:hypothetical protein
MHYFDHIRILQNTSTSVFEIITVVATLLALIFAIYQSILARRSLDAARKSIDEDKRVRQLSMIPKMSSVIEVQIRLDRWINDLEGIKSKTLKAVRNHDDNILKDIAVTIPRHPNEIVMGINPFIYEKMPDSLKEIMMSGAQYFYDAMSPAFYLWTKEKGSNWSYAGSIYERYDKSISALRELKTLILEMIPEVLLETPASINSSDFLVR